MSITAKNESYYKEVIVVPNMQVISKPFSFELKNYSSPVAYEVEGNVLNIRHESNEITHTITIKHMWPCKCNAWFSIALKDAANNLLSFSDEIFPFEIEEILYSQLCESIGQKYTSCDWNSKL